VVVTVVGLWWWEVSWAGLGPADVDDPQAGGVLLARWAAHAVLFSLLAAAAWIDLRHRVIPDCVTVPGVIVGLAVLWLLPDVLLPIECEVSRSFAMPLRATDVLGWYGGLRSQTPPAWMGAAPHLPGLLIPATVFAAWWSVCTAPFLDPHVPAAAPAADAPSSSRRRIEPRNAILVVGLAAIAAAWWCGGERFLGLQSSLVGLAAAGGLGWSIREGASRALGREAMGLGDVTLMAMVGAWIGWQASVLAFFSAAFIGLAHGLLQVVRHRENELPYGPSLCLASAAVIIGWQPLWQRVGGPFMQPLELIAVIVVVVILTAVTLFGLQRLRR
jgi:prepilin signal peptidase PulO-like enzyme (type II secretory pathway)